MQLDATAFLNNYNDLIISVGRAFTGVEPLPHRQHLQRAGARRRARPRPGGSTPASTSAAAYTFLDSEILAVDGIVERAAALRGRRSAAAPAAPPGSDRRGVDARPGRRVRAGPDARRDARRRARLRTVRRPLRRTRATPWSTSAARGGRCKAVEVFARALNLFDRDYEEVLGYPAPGRTAYVGVRFAVGR